MELIESSSSWIIALGKTLLNSLWIGLLFLSLLKAIFLLISHKYSGFRYRASLLSLILFTGLTAALFLYLYSPDENIVQAGAVRTALPEEFPILSEAGSFGANSLYQFISLVYFSGMTIYLLITLPGLARIRNLRKDAAKISGHFDRVFTRLTAEAGIRSRVEFLVSEHVSGPFLTGVFKPALIVPVAMLSQLSFREVEAILMHEIYHLKKLDHVVNLLQKLIEILFFFNPAVWLISGIIRTEREKRCDDLVLSGSTRALDYATALYTLSCQDNSLGLRATAATGRGKGELLGRIERILKPNTMKSNYREKINTLIIFACGIGVVLLVSGFTSGFSIILHHDKPPAPPETISSPIPPAPPGTISSPVPPAPPETISSSVPQISPEATSLPSPLASPEATSSPAPLASPEATSLPSPLASPECHAPLTSLQDTLTEKEKERIHEEVRKAFEGARDAAMDEIDWEQIKMDMEEARLAILDEIDWDEIKEEMEELKIEAMEEIDWDEIKEEMENIDWDQMKTDMADLRIQIDSMLADFDFDMDPDMDLDMDYDTLRKDNNNEDSEEEKR